MGRPKKYTIAALKKKWEEYKLYCDNQMITTHDFSSKNSEFVTKNLKHRITYTIEGFCVFADLSRSTFYEYYVDNPRYADMVTRMKEECEIDARIKFETGELPTQLAGLWMSRHGYTVKNDTNVSGAVPVVISGDDELED